MSRTLSLVALAIVAVFISSDRTLHAAAPTTQPDLSAQNTLLKKIIAENAIRNDQLLNQLRDAKNRYADLEIKMRALQQQLADHEESTLKLLPYRIQLPTPSPLTPNPDSILGSFTYNGKTVYLVGPLAAKRLTVPTKAPLNIEPATPVPVQR